MTLPRIRWISALLAAALVVPFGIAPAQTVAQTSPTASAAPGEMAAIARARADSARYPYTAADIHFMSTMIGHHAQAIVMASMAPSHAASSSVKILAERIINAQKDEIRTMQQWLQDRRQPVPDADTGMAHGMAMMHGSGMTMNDPANGSGNATAHEPLMPGMLTEAQMKQLDSARGPAFDRLFLTFMIQHHRGAVTMVRQLFDTYGAAQDELVFKLASDINVDQNTEIARMQRMLIAQMFDVGTM
jgi:uncharacterized protein (DUF305 family)